MKRLSAALLAIAVITACTPDAKNQGPQVSGTQERIALQTADNYRKAGDLAAAIKLLRDTQARQPNNTEVLNKLGYILIDAKQPEEAVDVFDQVLALDSENAIAYNGKGVAFDISGNHLAAQELYQHSLKFAPDTLSTQNNLAMSLILNNQIDQAILLLEKLNMQYAGNRTVRQNLALAYGIKGNKERAMAINQKDLPPEQVEENMRFYEQYRNMSKELRASAIPTPVQIGFADTPPEQKAENSMPVPSQAPLPTPVATPAPISSPAPIQPTASVPASSEPASVEVTPAAPIPPAPINEADTAPIMPAPVKEADTVADTSSPLPRIDTSSEAVETNTPTEEPQQNFPSQTRR